MKAETREYGSCLLQITRTNIGTRYTLATTKGQLLDFVIFTNGLRVEHKKKGAA